MSIQAIVSQEKSSQNICKIEGCHNRPVGKRLCNKHYKRFGRYGYNKSTFHDRTIKERLLFRATEDGSCLIWNGGKSGGGYGSITIDGQHKMTHRVCYEEYFGEIPDGLLVCHRCDNPPCINPDHLFLGTQSDNLQDMYAKGRQNIYDRHGVNNSNCKLKECDVVLIRDLIDIGTDRRALVWLFGVCATSINNIAAKKSWSHV